MSFADPLSITIAGVTTSLPRVSQGNRQSSYEAVDAGLTFSASSQVGKRIRRVARVDHQKIGEDQYVEGRSIPLSMSCYVVFDLPLFGYTGTQAKDVFTGLDTLLNADTQAVLKKLLNGES